jgi:hypothetical protein
MDNFIVMRTTQASVLCLLDFTDTFKLGLLIPSFVKTGTKSKVRMKIIDRTKEREREREEIKLVFSLKLVLTRVSSLVLDLDLRLLAHIVHQIKSLSELNTADLVN